MPSSYHPFVSRKAQLIFYLTQMDGEQRCDAMKITEAHYTNADIARLWLDDNQRELGPRDAENAAALDKLKDMYEIMVYPAGEEEEVVDTSPVLLPHSDWATIEFEEFIRHLESTLTRYYYSNLWLVNPNPRTTTPTEALIFGLAHQLVTHFAMNYAIEPMDLRQQRRKFTLVTRKAPLTNTSDYPLEVDLITRDEEWSKYPKCVLFGEHEIAPLDKLLKLYADIPDAWSLKFVDLSPEILIKMVIFTTFAGMDNGSNNPSHFRPAVSVCLARLKGEDNFPVGTGSLKENQIGWIPVVPPNETIFTVLDRILGFSE